MSTTQFCQSCSMPLESADLCGTEKDGSHSDEYCRFCYQRGEFVKPGLTLSQMKDFMQHQMKKENIPPKALEAAIARLPFLKRWRTKAV